MHVLWVLLYIRLSDLYRAEKKYMNDLCARMQGYAQVS